MSSEIAVRPPLVKASTELSTFLGMEVSAMIDALKSQAFKGRTPDQVTDAQLATYISTANALKLNPLLPGQMYAYPDRQGGGVTVMIGPDGVFTLLSNNPDIIAQKDGGPAFWAEHGTDSQGKETCTGFVNHRTKGLLKKTIWVDEWVVSSNPNWASRRHHMAEVRALKQAARMVIHGLPADSDEHKLGEMMNVTGSAEDSAGETPPPRPTPPPRKSKGASAAAAEPAAIDVVTTPTPTAPAPESTKAVETPKPAEPAKTEKVAEPVAQEKPATQEKPKPAGPRTSVNEAERISVRCTVKEIYTMMITVEGVSTPCVQAKVEGEFTGDVYQLGGASKVAGTDDIAPTSPLWKKGATVVLGIFGKINKKSGKVLSTVTSIAPAEGSPDTAIDV